MDLQLTGSDELIYLNTPKVSVTIKGNASHPNFDGIEYKNGDSMIKIHCLEDFGMTVKDEDVPKFSMKNGEIYTGVYSIMPLFYEQQNYEVIIEGEDGCDITFWHDNLNIRNKISRASRNHEILSGVINFGNEIGYSDLVIRVNGVNYLRLILEVFPAKIDYKKDYIQIVEDVTKEVYNVVFDFLRKTYLGYQQSDKVNNSPVEFFAIINKIFDDFIRAIDLILSNPHHLLKTTHEILPSHKVKRIDCKSIRWIEKHPDQSKRINGQITVARALTVKKQITYDTKENQLTKYFIQSTIKNLEIFKMQYSRLQRKEDKFVINKIDGMVRELSRRCTKTFLIGVSAKESSSGLSLVFSMAPGYRELYKYYLMLLRGLSISGDVFNISVKDIALLYEYWCFIKLNSILKDKYELLSQDIIKVQGNGLYVALVKGASSKVKYRNQENGETIILSYNPTNIQSPTVSQKPDNVLSLEKKTINRTGKKMKYEYVFDAKYRVNPALEGTTYYKSVSHKPGPEVSDINTMHRYRDAIVYANGAESYERTMFGAYVLFPYSNEEEYRAHKFFESIDKVNVGGLPFLPTATRLVKDMLESLISDSTDSAFERATLPIGIEDKLAKIDWSKRDVLVGDLRNKAQLNICLQCRFYHVPAVRIRDKNLPIHYVAIYQSKNIFTKESGIRYYGEVISCTKVKRRDITEIPKDSDAEYYRFDVNEWRELSPKIEAKEINVFPFYTNMFLLKNCEAVPDLHIKSEGEYRLYTEISRIAQNSSEDDDVLYKVGDRIVYVENGEIIIAGKEGITNKVSLVEFMKRPSMVFNVIKNNFLLS